VGLYVNKHVRDPIQLLADAKADSGGDLMRREHGHGWVHFQVQVDMVAEPGLTRKTFFHPERAGNTQRSGANLFHLRLVGHGVHELQCGIARYMNSERNDDQADGESAPMIGRMKLWKNDGHQHSCQRDRAGQKINQIVPGIGAEGSATGPAGHPRFDRSKGRFHADGSQHDPDRQ